ncbi:hypothetical protein HDK77DRAFT_465580 [Phyllosticta capitalensis]
MSSRDDEPARRRKHRHSDLDSSTRTRDKNPDRIRSSKTSHKKRPKSRDRLYDDAERDRPRSSRSHQSHSTMSGVPELNRRPAKASPYPEFSKAHSKEAPFTPDPTDLGKKTRDDRASPRPASAAARHAATAPPSPPLTADDPDLRRRGSGNSMRRSGASANGRRSADPESQREAGTKTSHSSLRKATTVDEESELSGSSKPSTAVRAKGARSSNVTRSAADSDATSIAPDPPRVRKVSNSSPSVVDSSPRTPNSTHQLYPSPDIGQKGTPMVEVFASPASRMSADHFGHGVAPPPPPPPPMMPPDIPRVDYLLANGGLSHTVPKGLIVAADHSSPNGVRPPPSETVQHIFAPFRNLLDDYNQVMSKNGSIAVATGYRSVARRLLDRLEAVFARNISSETCRCVMCCANLDLHAPTEEDTGVSWGEILEFVSGRRELPAWPPFCIETDSAGLGISGMSQAAPMQKLDIDVPEEYREHYIKQSKKTKQAVQNWLASQPQFPSSPPQAVDDETLTFAMVTHLEPEKRPIFTALLQGKATIAGSRAGTPLNGNKPKSEILTKTALSLQRLYRLESAPRDPECAIFLLNNPELHGVLATMSAISHGEWDILVSGRFDGFLWSGAEGPIPPPSYGTPSISASRGPSRGPTATPLSRTTTPFSAGAPSRGNTPFSPGARNGTPGLGPGFGRTTPGFPSSLGAPVQMDEEVEIATLAEVEREIYLGMEALEDAFEALHCKAELVRRALRERGAGLAIAAQARRGSEGVEVRLGTPASNAGGWNGQGWDTETDDGIDDMASELAPDDSASNISYNRKRRGGRQKERKTPAPVVEEDESDFTAEVPGRRRR